MIPIRSIFQAKRQHPFNTTNVGIQRNRISQAKYLNSQIVSQSFKSRYYSTQAELASPQYKIEQLLEKGSKFVLSEQYTEALPILEGAIDFLTKLKLPNDNRTACLVYLNLAYVHHRLQFVEAAGAMYNRALSLLFPKSEGEPTNFKTSEQATALLNYSEFLMMQKREEEGLENMQKAIKILRKYNNADTYLAAALSNYAGFLCKLEKYEDAREPCSEALKLFIKELGRRNEYTQSCYSNMYQILKKLNMDDAIAELEADWNTVEKIEGKLSDKELANITEQFIHSVKSAEAKANPSGPVKGTNLYKKQLIEFFDHWVKQGRDIKDPALTPILRQELDYLKMGVETQNNLKESLKKKRQQVIQKRKDSVAQETLYYQKKEKRAQSSSEWGIFDKPDYVKIIDDMDQFISADIIGQSSPTKLEHFLDIENFTRESKEAEEHEVNAANMAFKNLLKRKSAPAEELEKEEVEVEEEEEENE